MTRIMKLSLRRGKPVRLSVECWAVQPFAVTFHISLRAAMRPVVVGRDERERLRRQAFFCGVGVDVVDAPLNVVWRIAIGGVRPLRYHGMIGVESQRDEGTQRIAPGDCKMLEHRLIPIAVPADHQVRVIAENRTRITGVALSAHDFTKSVSHDLSRRIIQPDDGKIQQLLRATVIPAQLRAAGLLRGGLAPVMNRPERCKLVIVKFA